MTDLAPRHSDGQPGGIAIGVEPADRAREFDTAKRHTHHVRILRIALPVFTVAIIGLYVVSVLGTAGIGSNMATVALTKILPTDLAMQNPHYEGYSEDGSMYKVRAKSAKPDLKNTDLISLVGITAELIDAQKQKTVLVATRGLFDNKKSTLALDDGIDITGDNGLKAKLKRALVNSKTNEISTQDPVQVEFPAGSVKSDKMLLKQKQRHVLFYENVKANLKPPPQKASASEEPKQPNQMFVGSDKPVAVTSKTLDIFDGEKRAVFKGGVIAAQGTATLTTPELEASYDAGASTPGANKTAAASKDSAPPANLLSGSSGKLRRIVARAPVVMTQGPLDRVTCDAADFDALNETAVLTGNVVMSSGAGRSARSDRVDLDQARERAVLTGNVVVTQDKNVLKGRRLEVDQQKRFTLLTSPAGIGYGAGRISAQFVQTAGKSKTKKSKSAATGIGQTGAFRADPNAPLDITANQLLVKDTIKTAIFSGKVLARQGAFKISAAELHALYRGSAVLGNVSSNGAASSAAGNTSLTHVKAKRNVIITGNDGQRVTGDWADFDMAAGKAVVGGAVEARQGGNVVQGTRMTIDTKTGRTIIETAPGNTVAKPQGGGWLTTNKSKSGKSAAPGNKGRPSAVFYLNDVGKARQGHKPNRKPSTGSAWDAQTAPR